MGAQVSTDARLRGPAACCWSSTSPCWPRSSNWRSITATTTRGWRRPLGEARRRLTIGGRIWSSSTWTWRGARSWTSSTGDPAGRPLLPVIALTRRGDLKTKLAAFERGVDDILTVPFSPEELVARVLAIMRRTYGDGRRASRRSSGSASWRSTSSIAACASATRAAPDVARAEPALSAGRQRGAHPDPRRDPRPPVGRGLRGREQRRRPPHPQPARQAAEPLGRPRYIATVPGRGYRFLTTGTAPSNSSST